MPVEKEYEATYFRQRPDSPLQVAFVAPSSHIDAWARVPTKSLGNVRNFQRAELRTHVQELETFFTDRKNSSPTAIVVGFDPVRSDQAVDLLATDRSPLDRTGSFEQPVPGYIRIRYIDDPDCQDRASQISQILAWAPTLTQYILKELTDLTGLGSGDLTTILKTLTAQAPLESETTPPPITNSVNNEFDDSILAPPSLELSEAALPADVVSLLAGKTPSEREVVLGRLTFLSTLTPARLQTLQDAGLFEVYRAILDELKPALIIDGQHRVRATARLPQVPFLVTALPTADWPELAFQFIVTNHTARRVKESLLISIVGTSLSRVQRQSIDDRLRQAKIRVGLIEAVMRVHEDISSPFYGMLAFGMKDETGFLDAAALRSKVVDPWYNRKSPVRDLFDHLCQGTRMGEKTEFWQDNEKWFEAFVAFWSAVKDRYAGAAVFSPELRPRTDRSLRTPVSRLMGATVLSIFQKTILDHLLEFLTDKENTEETPIAVSVPDFARFAKLARSSLKPLSPEFFQGWETVGFDGSETARADLEDAIRLVLKNRRSVMALKDPENPHPLFRTRVT